VSPLAEPQARTGGAHGDFVSDVLHKLSQPLTALQCSLELALVRDQTAEEFRASVEAAVQNAERLRQNLLLLQELSDADDPGDISAPVPLHELLRELQQDFLPVCESAGGCFVVHCDPLLVRGNGAKLRRAFFYLVESLLRDSQQRRLSVAVEPTEARQVEIRMSFSGDRPGAVPAGDNPDSLSTGELELARRVFRAVGGNLVLVQSADESAGCEVRLLLAGQAATAGSRPETCPRRTRQISSIS